MNRLISTALLFVLCFCCLQVNVYAIELPQKQGATPSITIDTIEIKPYDTSWYITGYCACAECCGIYAYNRPNGIVCGSSGKQLIPGYSCAADLPSGTIVEILYPDGTVQERRVDDTGGGVHGKHLDLYEYTHEQALQVGRNNVLVRIKEAP